MALLIGNQWREDLQSASDGIQELQASFTGDSAILSVQRQLSYLIALADDIEQDDSALEEITLGYIAMHQLPDILPADLSELLCQLNDRVRRYLRRQGRSLKTDQF